VEEFECASLAPPGHWLGPVTQPSELCSARKIKNKKTEK